MITVCSNFKNHISQTKVIQSYSFIKRVFLHISDHGKQGLRVHRNVVHDFLNIFTQKKIAETLKLLCRVIPRLFVSFDRSVHSRQHRGVQSDGSIVHHDVISSFVFR